MQMKEINRSEMLAAKPYDYFKKIKTFDEMVAFQKAKKYKFAWVLHKCVEQGIEIPEKYNYMRRIMNI